MNLENRFFYRLVKVFNLAILVFLAVMTLFVLWKNIPPKIPNDLKSVVVCEKTHTRIPVYFLGIVLPINYHDTWSDLDDKKATNFCSKQYHGNSVREAAYSSLYDLKIIYNPRDWYNFCVIATKVLLIFLVASLLLNICCETLLYLFLGKKLSWRWIIFFFKKN